MSTPAGSPPGQQPAPASPPQTFAPAFNPAPVAQQYYAPPGYQPPPGYQMPAPQAPAAPQQQPMPAGTLPIAPGLYAVPEGAPLPAAPAAQPRTDPYEGFYNKVAQEYGITPQRAREIIADPVQVMNEAMAIQRQAQGQGNPPPPVPPVATAAPGQPADDYKLPANWRQYVQVDPKSGMYVPVDARYQGIASVANHQQMQKSNNLDLLGEGVDKYFDAQPAAAEWLDKRIEAKAQAIAQRQVAQQKVDAFRKQNGHLLTFHDQSTGQPLSDQQGQPLLTPLGHSYRKHYMTLAQGGLQDIDMLMNLSWKSAQEEIQRAGMMPQQFQQQQQAQTNIVAPPYAVPGYAPQYAPPQQNPSLAAVAQANSGYNQWGYGSAAHPQPIAAGDIPVEQALRNDISDMDPNLPVASYFDRWRVNSNGSGRVPVYNR